MSEHDEHDPATNEPRRIEGEAPAGPSEQGNTTFDEVVHELQQARQQVEVEREKSAWLQDVSAQLFESTDPNKFNDALARLAKRLGCNRVYLRLNNPIGGKRDIVAEYHAEALRPVKEVVSEKYPEVIERGTVPIAPGQEIILVAADETSSALQRRLSRELDVRHAAVIPLTEKRQLQGELVLMSASEMHWSEHDLQLAKAFSRLISLLFEREVIASGLSESDERFNLAMKASQDGLWDAQLNSDRVYVSPSYFRMMGYDLPGGIYPREATGIYIHPDDRPMVRRRLSQFVDSDVDNDSIEFRQRHANGSDVWVLSRMFKAEMNADGTPSRIIGVNTDITEFKRIQQRLRAAQVEADAANRAKSEFLARISHEIRTPMNAIMGLSHLLLESELQTLQRGYVQHIDDAAQLLLSLINDILDFSRIEAGRLQLDETDFDLAAVISRLASLLIYKAEEKQIWLEIDIEPDVPLALHGDEIRLQQVLVNLLFNAVKFTSEGGVYFGIARAADGQLIFTVRDTGIGIDADVQQQLFMPFTQADGSITRRFGGSGLGLAISKYLVEMMHGTIALASEKGVGSQFTVTLPLAPQPRAAMMTAPPARRVAIISTSALQRRALANAFVRWVGAEAVMHYADLRELSAAVTPGAPWLCLVDEAAMSETQLIDSIAALRAIHPELVIDVAYLGCNSASALREQRLAGHAEVCLKPLTPERALALLQQPRAASSAAGALLRELLQRQGRVLLVEDNPVNQLVARGMIQKYELEVDVATNGRLAVELLQQRGPDHYQLVLMDMEMPEMDGYAATAVIRRDARFDALPIVAMTAHAMKGDRERCLAAGMNDYLSKPISARLLHDLLATYLQADRRKG